MIHYETIKSFEGIFFFFEVQSYRFHSFIRTLLQNDVLGANENGIK